MGRALFSQTISSSPAIKDPSSDHLSHHPQGGYEKWSISNPFDPDSDEFFVDAQYEAFIDPEASVPNTDLSSEASEDMILDNAIERSARGSQSPMAVGPDDPAQLLADAYPQLMRDPSQLESLAELLTRVGRNLRSGSLPTFSEVAERSSQETQASTTRRVVRRDSNLSDIVDLTISDDEEEEERENRRPPDSPPPLSHSYDPLYLPLLSAPSLLRQSTTASELGLTSSSSSSASGSSSSSRSDSPTGIDSAPATPGAEHHFPSFVLNSPSRQHSSLPSLNTHLNSVSNDYESTSPLSFRVPPPPGTPPRRVPLTESGSINPSPPPSVSPRLYNWGRTRSSAQVPYGYWPEVVAYEPEQPPSGRRRSSTSGSFDTFGVEEDGQRVIDGERVRMRVVGPTTWRSRR